MRRTTPLLFVGIFTALTARADEAPDVLKEIDAHVAAAAKAAESRDLTAAAAALQKASPLFAKAPPGWGRSDLVERAIRVLEQMATIHANEAWPSFEKKLKKTQADFDPVAAVKKPAAWKGKLIRLEKVENYFGTAFAEDDYDFITMVNGTAVAAKYEPDVKQAVQLYESRRLGKPGYGDEPVEAIIARVAGTCRVTVLDDVGGYKVGSYEAPLVKIVAIKDRFYAAAGGEKPLAEKLPSLPED